MPASLRKSATKVATDYGFSSLQEAIRVFLKQLSKKEVSLTFEKSVNLSPKAVKRYKKIEKDLRDGKNIHSVKDVSNLIKRLNED